MTRSRSLNVPKRAERESQIQALLDRVETIEALQHGFADVKAGRTKPARDVFDRLRRKHRIPR